MARPAHRAPSSRVRLVALAVATLVAAGVVWRVQSDDEGSSNASRVPGEAPATTAAAVPDTSVLVSTEDTAPVETTAPLPAFDGWVNPASFGRPYGTTVQGMLTFRGNPTRSYYGEGPVPAAPKILWRFPASGGLCHTSTDQHGARVWCGTGWTGQANVWTNPKDGKLWLAFGAYDAAYHFLDPATGERNAARLPDGRHRQGLGHRRPRWLPPLLRGLARQQPSRASRSTATCRPSCWRLPANAVSPTMWNNDWDGAPLVIDDYLFEGGENSQFHIVKLNRAYGPDGKVTVNPQLVFHAPGWDAGAAERHRRQGRVDRELGRDRRQHRLLRELGRARAGLGHQRHSRRAARRRRVFRFWTGDDTDASVVADDEGYALRGVGVRAKATRGSKEVGQLMKLDPRKPDNPLVWSYHDEQIGNAGSARHVVDARRARRPRRHDHELRPGDRSRPGDGRGAMEVPPGGARVAVAGDRRRHLAAGRLPAVCCMPTT